MKELIVISGPANSGKFPLAKALLKEDPNRVLVHRDSLRDALHAKLDEWQITLLMEALAFSLIRMEKSPVICAWNLEAADTRLWNGLALTAQVPIVWLDTRSPAVQAMIP